jgi:hypothetical protein
MFGFFKALTGSVKPLQGAKPWRGANPLQGANPRRGKASAICGLARSTRPWCARGSSRARTGPARRLSRSGAAGGGQAGPV